MAVHFYILAREGLSMPNAYGTAAVLVISILVINLVRLYLDAADDEEVFVRQF